MCGDPVDTDDITDDQCVKQALHICVMSAKLHVDMYVHVNQAETGSATLTVCHCWKGTK